MPASTVWAARPAAPWARMIAEASPSSTAAPVCCSAVNCTRQLQVWDCVGGPNQTWSVPTT
ncbi:hypothetical protein [Saccharothrix sp. NRRL B-16348]|uniref:hypothetical protein n=1 Tax=Saccharothrix sp. NRRL B-16348 TaxID=1415542 RepID=UPI0012F77765|nr:hypothetical protein [Saccharothrix sp. NRRL B-16348]